MKMCIAFSWLFVSMVVAMAAPSRITTLTASSTNGGTVLRWTAPVPSGITTLTNMDVRYSTSPISTLNFGSRIRVVWLIDPGAPGTVQTATITGLTPNTTYYFAIKVQDSAGSWSTMSNLATVLVGNPTSSVILAWDANPEPDMAGYRIYYGRLGSPAIMADQGNVTSCTIANLEWGVTYYFYATAYNTAGGESDPSVQIVYTVGTP